MNEPTNSSNNNNRRRRRRRPPQQRDGVQAAPRTQQQPGQNSPQPSGNKKRPRRRRGGQRPQGTTGAPQGAERHSPLERLVHKYEGLRQQHLEARKKYFDLFDRADPKQKEKLERQFTQSMERLIEFENSLNEQDKELFDGHYNAYPEDFTYAQNHELPEQAQQVETHGEFEDPHLLQSQLSANYSHDTEESVGTLDDYKAYKGL